MKNIIKKSLVFVLSAALALSFSMPATKAQADTYDQVFDVSTQAEMEEALNTINGDTSGTGKYLININDTLPAGTHIELTKNDTTINGNNRTMTSGQQGNILNATNSGTIVRVKDIVFEGTTYNDAPGVFYALNGAKIEMNAGTIIQNNKNWNYFGSGVTVENAEFVMNGGTIKNCGLIGGSVCFGGGVAVINGSVFTMKGGTIEGCYVENTIDQETYSSVSGLKKPSFDRPWTAGGGVFVNLNSVFDMQGGTIKNCRATDKDGSVVSEADGGGVAVVNSLESVYEHGYYGGLDSEFKMSGGTITGCSAEMFGGGAFTGGRCIWANAMCTTQTVASMKGIPGVHITGGTIEENASSYGAGLSLFWIDSEAADVNVENATIKNNEAEGNGGGIEAYYQYMITTIKNCTITGNTAAAGGGGICLAANAAGYTTITGSTITNNVTTDGVGAGVYYDANSRLNLSGENIIQDNTYDGKLNNLNILDTTHLVYVTGSLGDDSKIGLSDPVLWGDGISDAKATVAAEKLTSGYITYNSELVPKDAFTSDHKTWYPDYSADGKEVRLVKKTNNSKIKGGNILVDGLIGVNLWVDLDASTEAEREAYSMQFTLDDHTGAGEVQTAEYDKDKYVENPETGDKYYGFTFEDVKAPQMADEITAELLQDGDETGVEKVYSVEQYSENMINKDSTKQDYKDFLRPMLNYGAFAQKYFNYNKSDLANKNNDMSDTVYEQTVDSKYEMSTEGGLSGIAVKHFGMDLNDGVDLHFEFTADSSVNMDDYAAVLNDDPNKPAMLVDDNGNPTHELTMPFTELETQGVKTYYVNIYNIPAHRYDDTLTVTLYKKSDPATTFKINFSVLSYAYEVLNKNAELPEGINEEDLKNLLKSMVLYNVWAEKYFDKYPDEYIRTKRVLTEKA